MNCDQARDAMLEAAPEELRGLGAGMLAAHIRECADCREAATTILAATAGIARSLDAGVAARTVAAVPNRARRFRLRTYVGVAVPLAVAAALALVLVGRGAFAADETAPYTPPVRVPSAPVVNTTGGSGVAVMNTTDPDITVIWNF